LVANVENNDSSRVILSLEGSFAFLGKVVSHSNMCADWPFQNNAVLTSEMQRIPPY